MSRRKSQDDYHEIIRSLSDRLVEAQTPIRVLDAIKWDDTMAQRYQTAVIVVTHDEKIIPTFRRIYHIRDGVTHEEAGEGRSIDAA